MNILKIYFILVFSFIYSYSEQFDYIKLESLDKNNATLKAEKKNELYEYVIKYKFGKYGYENDDNLGTNFDDIDDEEKRNLIFTNSSYLNDNIWLDLNFDYEDSIKKNKNGSGGILSENKVAKQQSFVKLYFKPSSIITTNLSFESQNEDSDIDINTDTYENLTLNDENKLSFDINLELDFLDVYTKFYQTNSNYNKFYKDSDSDYVENTNNVTRAVELTLKKEFFKSFLVSSTFFRANNDYDYTYESDSKDKENIEDVSHGVKLSIEKSFFDNLKIVTTGKLSDNRIKNSNNSYLIGKRPKYKARKQVDVNLEYKVREVKLFSTFTHMSNRYANEENTKKLDAYTVGTLGSSFGTKINNKDVKVNFKVKNFLNEQYYTDSDTKGEPRSYYLNMIMRF